MGGVHDLSAQARKVTIGNEQNFPISSNLPEMNLSLARILAMAFATVVTLIFYWLIVR